MRFSVVKAWNIDFCPGGGNFAFLFGYYANKLYFCNRKWPARQDRLLFPEVRCRFWVRNRDPGCRKQNRTRFVLRPTFSCCAVEITQKPRGIVEYALFTNTVHTFSTPLLRENRHRAANRYATESSSDLERSAKEFYGRIRQNRRTCLRPQEKRNRTCKQDRQTKGAPGAMQLRFRDIRRDLTPPPNYVRQKRRRVLVCTESIL